MKMNSERIPHSLARGLASEYNQIFLAFEESPWLAAGSFNLQKSAGSVNRQDFPELSDLLFPELGETDRAFEGIPDDTGHGRVGVLCDLS